MHTNQLDVACRCSNYIGVFSLDRLPASLPINAKFIVNTHTHNLPGQHWLAVDGNSVFDPFGVFYPKSLLSYLYRKKNTKLTFNHKLYQSPTSDVCGQFCLYFIHYGVQNLIPYEFEHNNSIIKKLLYCLN